MVTIDATNDPYIHVSGTTAECLDHLKDQNVPHSSVVQIWYNGSGTSCVYRR